MTQQLTTLLLDCLHSDPSRLRRDDLAALSETEWENLLALAAEQRVRGLLYRNLLTRELEEIIPGSIRQALKGFYTQNTLHNLRYSSALKQIVTACANENIPVLVLKGIYLAHTIYEQIGLREMNDIDLLVKRDDLARVAEIMSASGYQPMRPFSLDLTLSSTEHHLPRFIKPAMDGVEIHWSIVNSEMMPHFDITDFWNRSVPVSVAQTEMLGLCPADVLLYLCFHNAHHAFGFGLRPYCDIQAVIDHFSPALDWDQILARVQYWGWERGVYLSLRLARDFVGAKVPDYILRALEPAQDTSAVYSIARSQTFASKVSLQEITSAARYTQRSAWKKFSTLAQRFFPTRLEIAHIYHVAPDSWAIWFKYPLRWKYFFFRYFKYSKIMLNVLGSDHELAELASKQDELLYWLSDDQ